MSTIRKNATIRTVLYLDGPGADRLMVIVNRASRDGGFVGVEFTNVKEAAGYIRSCKANLEKEGFTIKLVGIC